MDVGRICGRVEVMLKKRSGRRRGEEVEQARTRLYLYL